MKEIKYNSKRTVLAMRSMYFIIWGSQFIGVQYMSIYVRSFSFTNAFTVGLIISLGYLITTVAQPVWGNIADHAAAKNRILRIAIAGVAATLWLIILPKHTSYLTLVPSVSLVFVFLMIPGMLTDTIIVENIEKTGVPFGTVRGFSSGGAGAVSLVMFLLSLFISLKPTTIFFIAFLCASTSFIPLHFLPVTKGHAYGMKGNPKKTNLKAIFANRRLVLLLCYILFLFIGVSATNTFLGIYYATPQGLNAGLGTYGLYFTICIAAETSLMLFGSRLLSKINIYNIFLLVCLGACFRALIAYLAPNIYVMQLSTIGHALLFAPLWSRLSPYVNSIVSKEMRATGQAAWYIMAFGLGPVLGSALGGLVADLCGIRNLFAVSAGMLFAVAVVFYFLFRHQRILDEAEI